MRAPISCCELITAYAHMTFLSCYLDIKCKVTVSQDRAAPGQKSLRWSGSTNRDRGSCSYQLFYNGVAKGRPWSAFSRRVHTVSQQHIVITGARRQFMNYVATHGSPQCQDARSARSKLLMSLVLIEAPEGSIARTEIQVSPQRRKFPELVGIYWDKDEALVSSGQSYRQERPDLGLAAAGDLWTRHVFKYSRQAVCKKSLLVS